MIESLLKTRALRLVPFIFENAAIRETAKHYLFHKTASPGSFGSIAYLTSMFCKWIGKSPDQLIGECFDQNGDPQSKVIIEIRQKIDEYIFYLRERKLRSTSLNGYIGYINAFFAINRVNLNLNFGLRKDVTYSARAITVAELQKVMQVADLREKAIVSILAVSGLRTNTLVKLQFRHVKEDLEKGTFPVHIGIKPQITKGKYQGYSSFINCEAAEYLKAYLNARRNGTKMVPPEDIQDDSPLIKVWYHKGRVDPISTDTLAALIRSLYFRSKVLVKYYGSDFHRYELYPNSFRKFFSSQMSFLGVQRQFIEYMMGHKTDCYLDIKMAGIEYLRRIYNLSGISVRPVEGFDRLTLLKQSVERLDFKPQDVLRPEILKKMNLK